MSPARLIQKLKQGDRIALNRAIDQYTSYISAVAWHAMGPAATAEDVEEVVSDTFLVLWSSRDTLDTVQNLKAWLAAVARNKAVDWLRRAPPIPLSLDSLEIQGCAVQESELERRMFSAALRQTVEALEPPDDQLILRFYYEEEALKDIAKELGLSVPAAKTRLHRARKRLKESLMKGGLADGAY
ncbi:MAG: sigma-70 family RNA polymerase sigma factor [Oscillospiraceae bacterium]|nr:sigma-70 family RNA polymerase sigma factor [Oscillospiraceae bacterium]